MSVEEIREAKDELIKMSNDDTQRELYEMRAKTLRDKISALNEAERKGIKKGREEGRKEGIEEGRKEGREQGRKEGRAREIYQSVSEGDYSMQRGAQKLSMTVDEFKQEMIKAGYRIMEVPVQ